MKLSAIFKHDVKLPVINSKQALLLATWIIVPNLFFLSFAWLNNLARPLINIDYVITSLFLVLPWRLTKVMVMTTMIVVFLTDALALCIQIFPFLDIQSIIYFLPFVFTAPIPYLITIGVIFISLIFWLRWTWIVFSQISQTHVLLTAFMLCMMGHTLQDLRYHHYDNSLMGRNNYYVIHSLILLWQKNTDFSFHQWMMRDPNITKLTKQQDYAAKHLSQPYASKILYIVAESLGTPRTEEMRHMMLQKLKHNQVQFFNTGHFDVSGATIQGELRELCQLNINNGYAIRRLKNNPFNNCLPNKLKQQGYRTVALHGATSVLYDRNNWYPKAGFDTLIFNEHLLNLPRCTPFKGSCDHSLSQTVIEEFRKNGDKPIFLYWLTLTSHAPYAKDDIQNDRFDCQKFGMRPDGDICRNYKLHTQFFDDLSVLLSHPNMKGTEVMIVGDHMPPLMGNEPIHPFLRWQSVDWIHFKIKN